MGSVDDELKPQPPPSMTGTAAGLGPADALLWDAAGFAPADARIWHRREFDVNDARAWRDVVRELNLRNDAPALLAAALRARGWTPKSMRRDWGKEL